MKNIFFSTSILILFLASCASTLSLSPIEVNNTLPTLTKSKFFSQSQAEEVIKTNKCKYLIKGRNYVAPVGSTAKNDLKNGAVGIDEWVIVDRGNAYALLNFKWVTVDHNGSTQLHIDFDTMLCE